RVAEQRQAGVVGPSRVGRVVQRNAQRGAAAEIEALRGALDAAAVRPPLLVESARRPGGQQPGRAHHQRDRPRAQAAPILHEGCRVDAMKTRRSVALASAALLAQAACASTSYRPSADGRIAMALEDGRQVLVKD